MLSRNARRPCAARLELSLSSPKPALIPFAQRPLLWKLAAALPASFALLYALVYVGCAFARASFPWELEWMEGGMLGHAARVLHGEPIYAQPSADFVAFFYTPLYSYVVAGMSQLAGGLSFGVGRAVSIAASLGTMALLFYAGRREAGTLAGLLAVGLYTALFRTCGAFYDLARADSLSLVIALGASLLSYYVPSYRGAALSGALFAAAFLTKQTTAVVAPWVGLYLLFIDVRRALVFGACALGAGFAGGYTLDVLSEGWFRFYTVEGHQGHAFLWGNFLLEYFRDVLFLSPFLWLIPALGASYLPRARYLVIPFLLLLGAAFWQRATTLDYPPHMYYRELWYEQPRWLLLIPPLVMLALLAAARLLRRSIELPSPYFLVLAVAGLIASDLNHSTQWAYSNCFMPVAVFGSLFAAITLANLWAPAAEHSARSLAAALCVSLAMLVQLIALVYDPRAQVPNEADREALASLEKKLASYPGPVFMPAHPLYAFSRDGTIHVHQMGIGDVSFAGGISDLGLRLQRGGYPTVVLDEALHVPGLAEHYVLVEGLRYQGPELLSKTGFMTRPVSIWRHRSQLAR